MVMNNLMNLAVMMVYTSHTYTLRSDRDLTIGLLAQYLSQQEAYVNAGTLEIARPVEPSVRLHDLDLRPGDRLVIFTQPATPLRPPTGLLPGDKAIVFTRGDYSVRSYGKRGLLVGKPDDRFQAMPDVDIRSFIMPGMLDYVSRGCLWLNFDSLQECWFATRMGETRVLIDEFELGTEKIALADDCTLNFYRAIDDPHTMPPIGSMRVQIEDIRSDSGIVSLPDGHYPVRVHIGTERTIQTLRASQNIPIGQIVTSLSLYNHIDLTGNAQVYLMRLVSPDTEVQALRLLDEEFLYVAMRLGYANNQLILRDSHGQHVYEIEAGQDDETRILGSRSVMEAPSMLLDIDLCDAVATHNPGRRALLPLRQGYIDYRAGESAWYVRIAEDARIPMFVNNVRVGIAPTRLLSGDVLTIGSGMADYFVRLEIEMTSRSD